MKGFSVLMSVYKGEKEKRRTILMSVLKACMNRQLKLMKSSWLLMAQFLKNYIRL